MTDTLLPACRCCCSVLRRSCCCPIVICCCFMTENAFVTIDHLVKTCWVLPLIVVARGVQQSRDLLNLSARAERCMLSWLKLKGSLWMLSEIVRLSLCFPGCVPIPLDIRQAELSAIFKHHPIHLSALRQDQLPKSLVSCRNVFLCSALSFLTNVK